MIDYVLVRYVAVVAGLLGLRVMREFTLARAILTIQVSRLTHSFAIRAPEIVT